MPSSEKEYLILKEHDLTLKQETHLQYSAVFSSVDFERFITTNKLWMGKKMRFQLILMNGYFSWVNALLCSYYYNSVTSRKKLSEEDIDKLQTTLLLQVVITLDYEFSGLLAVLETLIVDSIYKLDQKKSRKNMTCIGLLNVDIVKILK
jgi:hypothetical protein